MESTNLPNYVETTNLFYFLLDHKETYLHNVAHSPIQWYEQGLYITVSKNIIIFHIFKSDLPVFHCRWNIWWIPNIELSQYIFIREGRERDRERERLGILQHIGHSPWPTETNGMYFMLISKLIKISY